MSTVDEDARSTVLRREAGERPPPSWRTWLLGTPLSTAYATQEILVILAAAGAGAFVFAFPISIGIVILLAIVAISYEQTIHAYPDGGGAYIVSRDNLGDLPAQIAGAALLTDYILTVAVSVSSGVAQITSAFPSLYDLRVEIAILFIFFVMMINLRGVKESGTAFAIPTYFFIVVMFITVAYGFVRYMLGTLGVVPDPPHLEMHATLAPIGAFLLLHAFSSGTAALTGVEAISNGITAFREPRSRNAGITLIWMACILGTLFLGITYLSGAIAAVPSEEETVISQLARTIYDGQGFFYLMTIAATTVILVMAMNTAFADFPRLSALLARDGYLPRQLTFRGSRLVFSNGIIALSVIASLLVVIFQASVTGLIPLYAIGVFLSFTLSQGGMALRWWKSGRLAPGQELVERGSTLHYDKRWTLKMIINGLGAICTVIVMFVFAITKFRDGAWVVLILIPLIVMMFVGIHHHYRDLARRLSLEQYNPLSRPGRHRVILPISGVHRGTLAALRYARSLSKDVTAVHVSIDPEATDAVKRKWELWGEGVRLVIQDSPYRLLIEPLLDYIDEVDAQRQPNETITVVVPQFVPEQRWQKFLHTQAADVFRAAFLKRPGIVITDVPYVLKQEPEEASK